MSTIMENEKSPVSNPGVRRTSGGKVMVPRLETEIAVILQ
jgi:hypothetical protein